MLSPNSSRSRNSSLPITQTSTAIVSYRVSVFTRVPLDRQLTSSKRFPRGRRVHGGDLCEGERPSSGRYHQSQVGIPSPLLQYRKLMQESAAVTFTNEKVGVDLSGEFGKENISFLQENETTVSVTWTGGGQDLKRRKTSRLQASSHSITNMASL